MTAPRFSYAVTADACSGLLCRILGLFAQAGLPPPDLTVSVDGAVMTIEAATTRHDPALAPVMARKMAGFVGVRSVRFRHDAALPELAA